MSDLVLEKSDQIEKKLTSLFKRYRKFNDDQATVTHIVLAHVIEENLSSLIAMLENLTNQVEVQNE